MAYVPFTNDYTRDPQLLADIQARRTAEQSRVNDIIKDGNQVMGNLMATCCSDPRFAGQGFYEATPGAANPAAVAGGSSGYGTGGSSADYYAPGSGGYDPLSVLPRPGSYKLTPVDILTNTYGFPMRRDGKPWPRPRIPSFYKRRWAAHYPDINGTLEARSLVPDCACAALPPAPMLSTPVARETVSSEQKRLAAWRAGLAGLGQDSNPLSGVGGLVAVVAAAGILIWATKK